MRLKGKIACITGATAGIGEATARQFAAEGASLILTGRRKERLEALAASLDVPIHLAAFDVRERDATFAAFANLPADFTKIDILVNNAGLSQGLEPAHEADLEDWERMIDTNDKGLLYCTKAVLGGMVERNNGHVVNIGSTAGSYAYAGGNVYCASKAFVNHFSACLRTDLLGTDIRITSLEPALTETEFSLVRFHGDAKRAEDVYENVQAMTADDIADAILWAVTRPAHVNVNKIEMMPVAQASGGLKVVKSA